MGPQVQPKCFRHVRHMRNNCELRKRGYLIRFGHTEALLLKKKRTLNGHFSRPAETDPYGLTFISDGPNLYPGVEFCLNIIFSGVDPQVLETRNYTNGPQPLSGYWKVLSENNFLRGGPKILEMSNCPNGRRLSPDLIASRAFVPNNDFFR